MAVALLSLRGSGKIKKSRERGERECDVNPVSNQVSSLNLT